MSQQHTDEKYCGYPRCTPRFTMIWNGTELTIVAILHNELPVYQISPNEFTDGLARKCSVETFIGELSGVLKSTWSDRGKNGRTYGLYHIINIVYTVYGIQDERLTVM